MSKDSEIRFTRQKRRPRSKQTENPAPEHFMLSGLKDKIGFASSQTIRIINRRAKQPGGMIWPLELTAETVAAMLDYETTNQLSKAIELGQAPAPSSTRTVRNSPLPVWHIDAVFDFVAQRNGVEQKT